MDPVNLPPRQRLLLALAGALLIFLPGLATIAGVRAQPIENRPLVALPSVDDGWDALDDVVPFANDHLAFRDRAIRLDTWADENLFGDHPAYGQSTAPKVLLGDDSWLFLAEDLTKACRRLDTVETALANIEALHDVLEHHGKRLVFLVAPDKTTFMADQRRTSPDDACAERFKDHLWSSLATKPPRGYVDLLAALEAERSETGAVLYRRLDTHWNEHAAVVATRAVVEGIDPELWRTATVVQQGEIARPDDLTRMLGRSTREPAPHLVVRRSVTRTVRHILPGRIPGSPDAFHVTNRARGNTPLVGGKTLYFYDSFGAVLYPFLSGFFADIEGANHLLLPPAVIAERFPDADTVIYEVVERHLIDTMGDATSWAAILADLEQRLGAGGG